jgi:hypothetical protein
VLYNFDWVILLCLDILIFMYSVVVKKNIYIDIYIYIYVMVLSKVVAAIPFQGNGVVGRMVPEPHYTNI